MGMCKITFNAGDGFYEVEILKNIARATERKKIAEEAIEKLTLKLTELNSKKNTQQSIVDNLAFDINALVDTLSFGYNKNLADTINKRMVELNREVLKLNIIEGDISLTELAIVNSQASIDEIDTVPEKEVRSIWCADLTDDLIVGNEYGTLEINKENKTILIMPGGNEGLSKLQPTIASGNMTVVHNLVVLPAYEKWYPTYRTGIITLISPGSNTCTVQLSAANSSYLNLSINQSDVLTDVPIRYMTCDHEAFEEGTSVIVHFEKEPVPKIDGKYQFKPQGEGSPVVIGFLKKPVECGITKLMSISSDVNTQPYISMQTDNEEPVFAIAEYVNKANWGNVDWKGKKGNIDATITWRGPGSRYAMPSQGGSQTGTVKTDYFIESPIFMGLKEIKPLKPGYKTVGAGYKGADLVVFYLNNSQLSAEITNPEGEVISSAVLFTDVAMLMQIVAVSADGNKAVTMYNKIGEQYESYQANVYFPYKDTLYTNRVVDIDISDKFSTQVEIQSLYIWVWYAQGGIYRNIWAMASQMSKERVVLVDYKENERVTLTWFQQGAVYDFDGNAIPNGVHEWRSWFFNKDYREEPYYNEALNIRNIDLRYGFISYVLDTINTVEINTFYYSNHSLQLHTLYKDINKSIGAPLLSTTNGTSGRTVWLANNLNISSTYTSGSMAVCRHGNISFFVKGQVTGHDEGQLYFMKHTGELTGLVYIGEGQLFTAEQVSSAGFGIVDFGNPILGAV